jgi:toxin-antitoxin system PIN domain toxin
LKLVDANVLIYAVDEHAEHHQGAKRWLDAALSSSETVLLPWVSLLAFIRLVTHPSVFERPLDAEQALDVVDVWLSSPVAVVPESDPAHITRLRTLLAATGKGGNLVNDAHLAALALQHRAVVITFDSDFGRFPGVAWEYPDR